jgi:hypothetical protein
MRKAIVLVVAAGLAAAFGCSDKSPTSPVSAAVESSPQESDSPRPAPVARPRNPTTVDARMDPLPPGVWGSAEASLSVGRTGATLQILSGNFPTGGCYGKYGNIIQHVPGGRFSLPGTFTQLTGVYPGKFQYPAAYTGILLGDTLSLTVNVPGLNETFGPYVLVRGVTSSWTPCLYP